MLEIGLDGYVHKWIARGHLRSLFLKYIAQSLIVPNLYVFCTIFYYTDCFYFIIFDIPVIIILLYAIKTTFFCDVLYSIHFAPLCTAQYRIMKAPLLERKRKYRSTVYIAYIYIYINIICTCNNIIYIYSYFCIVIWQSFDIDCKMNHSIIVFGSAESK